MKHAPRFVCCFLLSTVCGLSSLAQSSNLPTVVSKLHSIRISEEMDTRVSLEAQRLLKELKHDLLDLITQTLNSPEGSVAPPMGLESAVTERLRKLGIVAEPRKTIGYSGPESLTEDTWRPYGQINAIRMEKPDSHPELLTVLTTLNIPCGEDSSLYVFERKQAGWVLKIQREENDYAEVSGAMGALAYRISPADVHGNWFLLIASSHPWCTSCWNGVRYQVLRPSDEPTKARVVYESKKGIYRCNDDLYRLSASTHDFSISYQGFMSHDPDLWGRVYIDHFQIEDNSVIRIEPLATDPEDFIDEWIDLPEEEAMRWVNPKAKPQSTTWHRKLSELDKDWEAFVTAFPLRQRCPTRIPSWQVGFSIETTGRKDSNLKATEIFFTVVDVGRGFQIDGIGELRQAGCPGEDRPGTAASPHDLKLPD